jgi:hypothetical protein
MNSRSQTPDIGAADRLFTAAKNNPEGLLLLAAGVALLARTARPAAASAGGQRAGSAGQYGGQEWADWSATGQASRGVESARQSAADLGGRVSETVSSYAASASRFANETTRRVAEQSGQAYESATSGLQDTMQRIVREQPVMIALAGVAAGAAVAAAFPRTDIEERTLGQAGERLADLASQKAEQVKNAGMAAGEHLARSAEQRGLSPDGLKEMAREAADAFGRSLSETGAGSGAGAGPQGRPGGTEDMERLE